MPSIRVWLALIAITVLVIVGCIYALDQALYAGADTTTTPKPGPVMGGAGVTVTMNMTPSTVDTPSARPKKTAIPWRP